MRIKLICPECAQATEGFGSYFVETIREDGFYTGKCPNGHDLFLATQTLKHEMLFEIAVNAISDGYYREAVMSFAASMERYFEFAIRVIASATVPLTAIDNAWKIVSKQSERQLGAYVFVYVLEYKEHPVILSNTMTEIRNNVAHKGSIPERGKAIAFGNAVYEIIQKGVQQLRATKQREVDGVLSEHVAKIAEKMGTQYPRAFVVTPTALNVIENILSGYKPFAELLRERGIQV